MLEGSEAPLLLILFEDRICLHPYDLRQSPHDPISLSDAKAYVVVILLKHSIRGIRVARLRP